MLDIKLLLPTVKFENDLWFLSKNELEKLLPEDWLTYGVLHPEVKVKHYKMEVLLGMVDSLGASQFKEVPGIGLYSTLSTGYLLSKGIKNKDKNIDYLEASLSVNDIYSGHRVIKADLYLYLPGKSGCCFVLNLSQGSRRFGAAFHELLLGRRQNNKINVLLQAIYALDESKAKKRLEELKKKLHAYMNEGLSDKFLNFTKKLFQVLVLRNVEDKIYKDSLLSEREKEFIENYLELKKLKSALDYQSRTKPVIKHILRVLQGEASDDDYIKIYQQFDPYQVND